MKVTSKLKRQIIDAHFNHILTMNRKPVSSLLNPLIFYRPAAQYSTTIHKTTLFLFLLEMSVFHELFSTDKHVTYLVTGLIIRPNRPDIHPDSHHPIPTTTSTPSTR